MSDVVQLESKDPDRVEIVARLRALADEFERGEGVAIAIAVDLDGHDRIGSFFRFVDRARHDHFRLLGAIERLKHRLLQAME